MTRTPLTLTLLGSATLCAQQPPTILLDPAQGGAQAGAHIADRVDEKQVTLAVAQRLASLLRARGFTVVMTRDADVDVTNDARAALANNTLPIACILLHATTAGRGVHLYTTAQHQQNVATGGAVLWDEAQASFAGRSRALEGDLKSAFGRSRIAASSGETWMRPLDNMECPAVAVEIAPESSGSTADNNPYQTQIASAIANTLLVWRGKVQSLAPLEPTPLPPTIPATKPAGKTVPTSASAAAPDDTAAPARQQP